MHIKYEWNEAKRSATLTERGIDFADMAGFDWNSALAVADDRRDYGEPRLRALGLIDGRLHAVVVTPRGDALRIISLRKANKREQRLWESR
jgi:uncharacterized protein